MRCARSTFQKSMNTAICFLEKSHSFNSFCFFILFIHFEGMRDGIKLFAFVLWLYLHIGCNFGISSLNDPTNTTPYHPDTHAKDFEHNSKLRAGFIDVESLMDLPNKLGIRINAVKDRMVSEFYQLSNTRTSFNQSAF